MISLQDPRTSELNKEPAKIQRVLLHGIKAPFGDGAARPVMKKRSEIQRWTIDSRYYSFSERVWKVILRAMRITTKKTHQLGLDLDMYDPRLFLPQSIIFKNTSEHFKKLKSLQNLSLGFTRSSFYLQMNGVYVSQICGSLKKLISPLQKLNLNFSDSRVIQGDREKIAKTIKRFKSLQSLTLNFTSWLRINDKELSLLSKSLRRLVSLQKLHLYFPDCFDITDAGLQSLSKSFHKLTSLQAIKLSFQFHSENLKVTDTGVKSLAESLEALKSLRYINFDLQHCAAISDAGLQDLNQTFESCKSLQYIRLNFAHCSQISDLGLHYISESIKNLKELQVINFCFLRCQGISDTGVQSLIDGLQKHNLSTVYLSFYDCRKITDLKLNEMKDVLKMVVPSQNFQLEIKEGKKKKK